MDVHHAVSNKVFNPAPRFPTSDNVAPKMSSRDIADLVGSRHDKVKQSIERLAARKDAKGIPVIALPPMGEYLDSLGRKAAEYLVCKRDSYIIVAQLSPEFTAKLVDRWQELEDGQGVKIPTSFAEALRLAAEQAERIEQQQEALAIAAPKAEFVDNYVEGTGLKGFRQVAKLLNANEPDFRLFLQDSKIMYRLGGEWMPYAAHVDAERFAVKTGQADNGHAFNTAKFTPKGIAWVAGLWAQYQLEVAL